MKELFKSFLSRYQIGLVGVSNRIRLLIDVDLLYFRCHKINLNCCGSYIDSPEWIKTEKVTINFIKKHDNKRFHYAATAALNPKDTGKYPKGYLLYVNMIGKT